MTLAEEGGERGRVEGREGGKEGGKEGSEQIILAKKRERDGRREGGREGGSTYTFSSPKMSDSSHSRASAGSMPATVNSRPAAARTLLPPSLLPSLPAPPDVAAVAAGGGGGGGAGAAAVAVAVVVVVAAAAAAAAARVAGPWRPVAHPPIALRFYTRSSARYRRRCRGASQRPRSDEPRQGERGEALEARRRRG